ncbi:hypothetical protein KRE40_13095 [Elizabethkingia meningoseptica]|uniref:hypothetical protein n=1 Tax=Elizabethkingia meningoseptica TaxID=238 RepID=UPI0023AEB03D|nr:hypothetical protein [Elizabethkingia meningoseptica]MDE5509581.1 hypothetical protein [Elizabethkingia meningoseptica]HAY3537103.1 hypothetical protein [Elizabethkingia anophelis]HAY3549220.1 hypothetical protein [Elizabethkingia anophelis]
MEKKQNTQVEIHEENREKRKYISPTLEVMIVEMECGIAANSAAVSPATLNGNTDQIQTDWNGNDDTTINAPF